MQKREQEERQVMRGSSLVKAVMKEEEERVWGRSEDQGRSVRSHLIVGLAGAGDRKEA
jgi:hypothetical protein